MNSATPLERGRELYQRRAWRDAYQALSQADQEAPLDAADLWSMAMSAYLIGREDDFLEILDRAHKAHLNDGDVVQAAQGAFWIGFRLAERKELGRATGWLGRAQRLLESRAEECVVHGYLLLPLLQQRLASGDYEASYEAGAQAAEIGERFGDPDLQAIALHGQGRVRLRQERLDEGLALLDEAMVSVTTGELSPVVTGIIYCSVIAACQEVFDQRRAQEWTTALSLWCESHPDMVTYSGQCMVHRSEVMQMRGEWRGALEEAGRALERSSQGVERWAIAAAYYQKGEVLRVLGEFEQAEEAYLEASRIGREPQPGLALLRLAQGNAEAAAAAALRSLAEATLRPKRAKLLPACIEILLAAGDVEEAGRLSRELEEIAADYPGGVLAHTTAHYQGAVALAEGDAMAALGALRAAQQGWQEFAAPYPAARARALIGLACREVGDFDTAELELASAAREFDRLGALPDLAWVEALRSGPSKSAHGLTAREHQVLRLVAAGATNKAIAAELSVSERTVDRHVSNIFGKLEVSSRAAATAYAYEHKLI